MMHIADYEAREQLNCFTPVHTLRQFLREHGDQMSDFERSRFIVAMNAIAKTETKITRPKWVYFFGSGGLVKIGFSHQPKKRLRQVTSPLGKPVYLVGFTHGGPALEKEIHRRFSHLRVQGEWFTLTEDLRNFISDLQSSQSQVDSIYDESEAA